MIMVIAPLTALYCCQRRNHRNGQGGPPASPSAFSYRLSPRGVFSMFISTDLAWERHRSQLREASQARQADALSRLCKARRLQQRAERQLQRAAALQR
jgi:hypothetical protein